MFRFVANVSLIICLAVAGVTAQDASTAIAQISGAAPLSSFFKIAAGSGGNSGGGDQLSKTDILMSLVSPFGIFHLLSFSSPLFSRRQTTPDTCPGLDVAKCRVTVDFKRLSDVPVGIRVSYRLGKQAVVFRIITTDIDSKVNHKRTVEDHFTCIIPESCVVDAKTAVRKYNEKTRVLTITFPHARPSSTHEANPRLVNTDPNWTDVPIRDEETEPTTSSDDDDEPKQSEDDNEQQQGEDDNEQQQGEDDNEQQQGEDDNEQQQGEDDNEQQQGDDDNEQQQGDNSDSGDFTNVHFLARPVSVITE